MSDWLLRTTAYRPDGIFSELYNGPDLLYVTLEHAYLNDAAWIPKIPRGATYACKRGRHRLEKMVSDFETFEITGVPRHGQILFHWGNFNRDSSGCVLIGKELKQDVDWWISHSKDKFAEFMAALTGIDEFQLRVE